MVTLNTLQQQQVPVLYASSPRLSKLQKKMVAVANAWQIALAEAYINGLEIPDKVLRTILDLGIPILFKAFPFLVAFEERLLQWLINFDSNQDRFNDLNYGIKYHRFRRIWRLYLIWCMAYFEACQGEVLGNGQYLMTLA